MATINPHLTSRDMLKLSMGGAGAFALAASGFSIPRGFGSGGSLYIEAFPTSPLILNAFRDIPENQLFSPKAFRPMDGGYMSALRSKGEDPYDRNKQDCFSAKSGPLTSGAYMDKYKQQLGSHQVWPGDPVTKTNGFQWQSGWETKPVVYQMQVKPGPHNFTHGPVLPI